MITLKNNKVKGSKKYYSFSYVQNRRKETRLQYFVNVDFGIMTIYDNFMLKNILKFLVAGVGIAVLGIGAMYGVKYFKQRNDPDYLATLEMEKLNKLYAEDTFGGDTPEETLRLFIDALKKGDTDLAAKYFVLDKQPSWKVDLAKIKEKGLLENMIKDLEREKFKYSISDKQVAFDVANEKKEAILNILLGLGPNNKWKILSL